MTKATVKQLIFAILALGIMAFVFYNSACTADVSDGMSGKILAWINETFGWHLSSFIVRKVAHFLEFTALGFCLLPAIGENIFPRIKRRFLIAGAIGFLYAISDEVHQIFVPGRSCEFRDMCIDFAGIVLGILIARLLVCRRKKV